MSQSVHLLKFYEENSIFFEEFNERICSGLLCAGKRNDKFFRGVVERFNADNNLNEGPNYPKGLSLPRLKILLALYAQMKEFTIRPSLSEKLWLGDTPERFQTKFKSLLAPGFWLLGTVIEDSLSDDPVINCGNPFNFLPEDLGYWWAGVVILDWIKYVNVSCKNQKLKKFEGCLDFYKEICISRKYRNYQNQSISSLKRFPEQFLSNQNKELFLLTIENVESSPLVLLTKKFREIHNERAASAQAHL